MHWPLISYMLYGSTRFAWLLLKINNVSTADVFKIKRNGEVIKYLNKDRLPGIVQVINEERWWESQLTTILSSSHVGQHTCCKCHCIAMQMTTCYAFHWTQQISRNLSIQMLWTASMLKEVWLISTAMAQLTSFCISSTLIVMLSFLSLPMKEKIMHHCNRWKTSLSFTNFLSKASQSWMKYRVAKKWT